ncbi:MAG: heavy-metal-associated domain-containing protein [Chitinophagaceae bacterium]
MKKIFFMLWLAISGLSLHAQFSSAVLQASGLTCAMCSKAINNSLEELAFIQSVKPDIKNSAFNIQFKSGDQVNIDELRKAVEDAGFAIAKLRLSGRFDRVGVKNDEHVQLGSNTFHFLNVKDQTLDGNKQITIVDKSFLTIREFRKYSSASQRPCVQTGKTAVCRMKEGISGNTRIYHVTI